MIIQSWFKKVVRESETDGEASFAFKAMFEKTQDKYFFR